MINRSIVESSPAGISYLMGGHAKDHIAELADQISKLTSGDAPQLSDEEFRKYANNTMESIQSDINDLVVGMNKIYDVLKAKGLWID